MPLEFSKSDMLWELATLCSQDGFVFEFGEEEQLEECLARVMNIVQMRDSSS